MKQMPVYLNEYRFPKIKERLPYLDMMKGIAMILVMLSHISIAKETAIVFKPFFLPVFFVASGYTFHIKNTFSQFLWNKVKTLLFPAFLLSLLQIALSCILTFTEQDPLPVQLTALLLQNGGQGSKMWFVFALFVCCIPFYFMVRLIDRTFFFIVLSVAGLILGLSYNYIGGGTLPWYLHLAGIGCFWMAVGYLWRVFCQYHGEHTIKVSKMEICLALTSLAVYVPVVMLHIMQWKDLQVSLRVFDTPVWLYLLESATGTLAACLLIKRLPSNRLLVFIGQNTLVYFAFHGKVQRAVEVICSRIRISGVPETLLILVIQCICLAGAGIIINRYFPFLVGKKRIQE